MNGDAACSHDEVDALADEIAVAAATMDSAMHGPLVLIRRFDEQNGWARQGSKTCAHWLSWRIGDGLVAAREKVRVARALGGLPLIDEAMRQGTISYSKARAMTRVATRDTEAALIEFAKGSTGAQLDTICRGFRQVARECEGGRVSPSNDEERFVRQRRLPSGMVRIEAQLSVDEAATIFAAMRNALSAAHATAHASALSPAAASPEPSTDDEPSPRHECDERTSPHSRDASAEASGEGNACVDAPDKEAPNWNLADGLVLIAETSLAVGPRARSGGERNQLLIHLSEERLSLPASESQSVPSSASRWKAVLADGSLLSGDALLRLACDSGVVVASVDRDGGVLDVGRKMRTVSPALLRALWMRDGGCRFPGCANRIVEAHHIVHWAHGGDTSLANTTLLCSRHHHALHEQGFQLARSADGALQFFDPTGRAIPAVPELVQPAPIRPADGIAIDHKTSLPGWDGRPLDRHAAVGALVARAGLH